MIETKYTQLIDMEDMSRRIKELELSLERLKSNMRRTEREELAARLLPSFLPNMCITDAIEGSFIAANEFLKYADKYADAQRQREAGK